MHRHLPARDAWPQLCGSVDLVLRGEHPPLFLEPDDQRVGRRWVSVAQKVQRLCNEQVVVLEDAAVAGVRVNAQLGVGQQLGEVE
jgi:hypothetical protein